MSCVCCSQSLSCSAERLARATASPEREVIRDASKSETVGPPTDAGEEVHLVVLPQVFGLDIADASLIDFSR